MADVRLNTLPVRNAAAGLAILGYEPSGKPAGVSPVALWPTLADIGGVTQATMQAGLDAKQDSTARGVANGYAPLGSDGKVPAENLPAGITGGADLSDDAPLPLVPVALPGVSTEAARADHQHAVPTAEAVGAAPLSHTHSIAAVTGLTAALAAKQDTSAKAAPNGYAPLDSNGKVPSAHLPAGISQSSLDAKADEVDVQAALTLKLDTSALAPALAAKADLTDSRIVNAVQPGRLATIEAVTGAYTAVQNDANKIKRCTSIADINVTLPALSIGTTIRFLQGAAGKMQFVAGSGVTFNSFGALDQTAGQGANVIATMETATVWNLSGTMI